jgi:DNA-binding CsgD family transcriptional regulator
MDFVQRFSELIGGVYETALTRPDWSRFAVSAAHTYDARLAGVRASLTDSAESTDDGILYSFADISVETDYRGRHFMVDELWHRPRGRVSTWQHLSRDKRLDRSDYYAAFKLKNGIEHTAMVLTGPVSNVTNLLYFIRHRSQEAFSGAQIESMGVLAAHFKRAMQLAAYRSDAPATNPLDRFQCAAFVVDQQGRIVLENDLATSLLRTDELPSRDGRLRFGAKLEAALSRMAAGPVGLTPSFFDIERSTEAGHLAAMVSQAPAEFVGHRVDETMALVLVSDPNRFVCPPAWSLKQEYGLTSAEARFVISFVRSKGVREAARHLGIGWETGRRHLKSVFEKTRTHSQVELTHLLLKHPASILGEHLVSL